MKLIEWQNESSLFTLRVRGKQWYWVYKLDFKNFTNIITAPKNIGHNKWVLFSPNNINQSDDYLSSIQLRKQSKWAKQYWSEICGKEELIHMPFNSSFYDTVKLSTNKISQKYKLTPCTAGSNFLVTKGLNNLELPQLSQSLVPMNVDYSTNMFVRLSKSPKINTSKFLEAISNTLNSKVSDSTNHWLLDADTSLDVSKPTLSNTYQSRKAPMFDDSSRFFKRKQSYNNAVTIRPVYISDDSVQSVKNGGVNLLTSRFESGAANMSHKPAQQNYFMVMKQKRYKRRKSIADTSYQLSSKATNYYNLSPNNKTLKGKILLTRDNQLERSNNDLTKNYNFFRKK